MRVGKGVASTMTKKGIRVKDLATKLGITSRTILSRCREQGIRVQNSIGRLSADDERTVRSWFSQDDHKGLDATFAPPAP